MTKGVRGEGPILGRGPILGTVVVPLGPLTRA